jgi:hypothetical protein
MKKVALLAGVALIGATLVGAPSAKAWTVIGTEDNVAGFVGNFLESAFPGTSYIVASDGESAFDPFGAGYDTSDGLNFSAVGYAWYQDASSIWTSLGNQTWVLPADLSGIGCGVENGVTCEPVGHFWSPCAWNPAAIGTWVIMEQGGGVSDIITTFNSGRGAELTFASDPIPEPSTWAMMLIGFAGLGFAGYRKAKAAPAA